MERLGATCDHERANLLEGVKRSAGNNAILRRISWLLGSLGVRVDNGTVLAARYNGVDSLGVMRYRMYRVEVKKRAIRQHSDRGDLSVVSGANHSRSLAKR